jgi:hypothetical protein
VHRQWRRPTLSLAGAGPALSAAGTTSVNPSTRFCNSRRRSHHPCRRFRTAAGALTVTPARSSCMLDTPPCMTLTRCAACKIVSQGMYQAAPQQAQGMYQAAPQQMYATQEVLVREPHVYHSTSSPPFLAQPLMVFCDHALSSALALISRPLLPVLRTPSYA